MTHDFPRQVAVNFVAETSGLTLAVVKELKRRTGCDLHLYVTGPEGIRKYHSLVDSGLFKTIEDCAAGFDREIERADLDEAAVFYTARDVEKTIGCTYNEAIMCRRDIGLGFSLGGFRHPRSPRSETSTYV